MRPELQEALRLHRAGLTAQAEQGYLRILAADPADPIATHYLGLVRLKQAKITEALELLRRSITFSPSQPDFHLNLGIALLDAAQPQQAIPSLERAISLKPSLTRAHLNLGKALCLIGEPARALPILQTALDRGVDSVTANLYLANALWLVGQSDQALQQTTNGLRLDPYHRDLRVLRGRILNDLQRFEEAIAIFDQLLLEPSPPVTAHLLRGHAHKALGQLASAKSDYATAVTLDPQNTDARLALGTQCYAEGDRISAVMHLQRCVELSPDHAEAYCALGIAIHGSGGKIENALAMEERALAINPRLAIAWHNKGVILDAMNQRIDALGCFKTALSLAPDGRDSMRYVAKTLDKLGRIAEALRAFDELVERFPKDPEARFERGALLLQIAQEEKALADFDKAIALDPNYPDALWGRGFICLTRGHFNEGLRLNERRFDITERPFTPLESGRPRLKTSELPSPEPLLLWSEQGVGDEVFFAGWLGSAGQLSGEVLASVDERLIGAYERSFPGIRFLSRGKKVPESRYHSHLPLGSLPKTLMDLGVDWQAARPTPPYLKADPLRVQQIRADLQHPGTRLCGLTWRSTRPTYGAEKSLPLSALLPILSIPGLTFVDLQYGDTAEEIDALRQQSGLQVLRYDPVDNLNDLEGHLALIEACDLVVSVCNATAHLTGALGKPGFILAPHGRSKIWYWANRGPDGRSLWYPSLAMFDQSLDLSWNDALPKLELALRPA